MRRWSSLPDGWVRDCPSCAVLIVTVRPGQLEAAREILVHLKRPWALRSLDDPLRCPKCGAALEGEKERVN